MPRKKVSTAEKKKRGTRRRDEMHQLKKHDTPDYPVPIARLTRKVEKEAYIRICDHLKEAGNLYDIDAIMVTMAAVATGKLSEAIAEWKKQGSIQVFPNDTRNISPELTAVEKVFNMIMRMSPHLGLSVKSRQDLVAFLEITDDDDDLLDDLMTPPKR